MALATPLKSARTGEEPLQETALPGSLHVITMCTTFPDFFAACVSDLAPVVCSSTTMPTVRSLKTALTSRIRVFQPETRQLTASPTLLGSVLMVLLQTQYSFSFFFTF